MPARMKLTDIDLIEALGSPEYSDLLSIFQERTFQKKQIISLPNHEENLVMLVKKGRVRVFLSYEDKEFTLSILEQGDIFSMHTRAFTQALDNDTVLLVAKTKKFGEMITRYPQFSLIMIKVLGDLLKNSITIINGLVFQEAHTRLAEFLINAAKDKGCQVAEGIQLELGLNVEDISTILGTSRQTVSFLLNDFYKNGLLLKVNRRTLIIKDMDMLKKMLDKNDQLK